MTNIPTRIMNEVQFSDLLDIEIIKSKLCSTDREERLCALLHIRHLINHDRIISDLFELAVRHIEDIDSDCRWQAIIIIGEFLNTRQEDIWKIIITFGSSDNGDIRTAIATVLLEHFFEENSNLFDIKFETISHEISKGNKNLINTLSICRFDLPDNSQIEQINKLINDNE